MAGNKELKKTRGILIFFGLSNLPERRIDP